MTEKLAQLYSLPVTDFMDAYNRFLYRGQADCIRRYRSATGLEQRAFARENEIPYRSLQAWESGKKTVSRQSWERYFRRTLCCSDKKQRNLTHIK